MPGILFDQFNRGHNGFDAFGLLPRFQLMLGARDRLTFVGNDILRRKLIERGGLHIQLALFAFTTVILPQYAFQMMIHKALHKIQKHFFIPLFMTSGAREPDPTLFYTLYFGRAR
jgi:hypothetical protein